MDATTSQAARTDAAHLRHLSPAFASETDITLCTTSGGVETELPAHAKVLSEHSHVLSEMITACAVPSEARIYMVGDSLTDLKALLTVMYQPLASSPRATAMTSHQLLSALMMLHKYAVEKTMAAVELQMVSKIEHAVEKNLVDHDTTDTIINYAAAGEQFELPRLRAYSEAYIALNLDSMDGGDLPLSQASMGRIATALAKRFKSARSDIGNLVPALKKSTARHAQYEAVLTQALRVDEEDAPDCPSENCKGYIAFVKVSKRRREIRCSQGRCTWASEHKSLLSHFQPHVIDSAECLHDLLRLLWAHPT